MYGSKVCLLVCPLLLVIMGLAEAQTAQKRLIDIDTVYDKLSKEQVIRNTRLVDDVNSNKDVSKATQSCELACPVGDHISISNGCGSYNFQIDFGLFNMPEFNTCCDYHDICYDRCTETKGSCDTSFGDCLFNSCSKYAVEQGWGNGKKFTCEKAAKMMVLAVDKLGCKAYYDSRVASCKCSAP